jgi:ketosteroid isomerase-like protein
MSTLEVVQQYFDALAQRNSWQSLLADDMAFVSHVTPPKQVAGKSAYLQSTSRFFSMIAAVELRDLIVDGERACALTSYALSTPGGKFSSEVAEVFTVRDGKIRSLSIYFDSTPFQK